jgi:O-antigen ligase
MLGIVSGVGNLCWLSGVCLLYFALARPKLRLGDTATTCQLIFALYLLAQAAFLGTVEDPKPRNYLLYSLVAISIGFSVARSINSKAQVRHLCRCFVAILLPLEISQIVTYGLLLFLSPAQITLFTFDTGKLISLGQGQGYIPITPSVLMPFTLVFGDFKVPSLDAALPRSLGIFREPGIYATYLSLTYLFIGFAEFRHRWVRIASRALAVLCIFLTGSTAGLAIFAAILMYKLVFEGRKLSGRIAVSIAIALTLATLGYIAADDIARKTVQSYGSDQSRFSSIGDSYHLLQERPFFGFGATITSINQYNEGINLLSSLHRLGIVGTLLYVTLLIASFMRSFDKKTGSVFLVMLLTIMFSQPLYFDCITFFLLNVSWSALTREHEIEFGASRWVGAAGPLGIQERLTPPGVPA